MSDSWRHETAQNLQRQGILLVEDGNHGEYRPRPSEFTGDGTAFIRAADMANGRLLFVSASRISDTARARITKGVGAPGDVILSHKGTVGKVALVGDNAPAFVCSPQTTFWRTLNQNAIDRRFLFAYMRSRAFQSQLEARCNESDMAPYVSLTTQRQLTVAFPPLPQQRAIAAVLGALDDKIELNHRMNATLEAMARALFKSWFIDFDPVREKASGRGPDLPTEIASLFPDSCEETESGEVPTGWNHVSLINVAEVNPATSLAGIAEAPYLDMANVPTQGYAVNRVIMRPVSSGSRFRRGDTLLARITPCLENGKTAFVDFLADDVVGWGSTEFVVIRPRDPMPKEYAYLLARSDAFRAYAIGKMTGTSGRQRVPVDSIAAYPVVRPSATICAIFASIVQPIFLRMSAASAESRTLASIRDALLPKLISGKIRVTDGEGALEKPA
jgi:type I restriction enzyme S subunit